MKKLIKDLKISHVLIFMTFAFTSFIVGLSYTSVSNLKQSRDYIHLIKNDRIEPVFLLQNILDDYNYEILDMASKAHLQTISFEEAKQRINIAKDDIDSKWLLYQQKKHTAEVQEKIRLVNYQMRDADLALLELDRILSLKSEENLRNLKSLGLYSTIYTVSNAVREIIQTHEMQIQQITEENDKLYSTVFASTLIFAIFIIIFSIILATFIISTITKSLKSANENIKKISEGDLTVEIEGYGKDELGQLLHSIKTLVNNLRSIIEIINTAANNIAITSHELSTNSQHISQGATEQAASVEQMAASMEEISSNIIQNAKNAKMTEQISTQAGAEFESGRGNIDTTVVAIQTIASKISIIGEIAFQTNILALNAAVEAARAGEHGKGFGVVAAEVGKLADRSKIAAAEIDTISKSGLELSQKSKELLKIALPSISKTLSLVKEISLASSEQSAGVDQINTGIQTLNQVTQQNAAASEEMATVAEQLSAQAEQLSNSISFFNIGIETKILQKKQTARKYLEQETKFPRNKHIKTKGIDLDMGSRDDLDNEFETF